MGQKVNPTGFRTGIMIGWKSRWYASKQEFSNLLLEDHKLRAFVKDKYRFAGIRGFSVNASGSFCQGVGTRDQMLPKQQPQLNVPQS